MRRGSAVYSTTYSLQPEGEFFSGGAGLVSTVPDYCELEVDRRTLPGETKEGVLQEYRDLLDDLAESTPEWDVGDRPFSI